ncbi:MAG: hypothetical protein V1887_00860 [Candidatus Aenigmatarchaeota archaeon]
MKKASAYVDARLAQGHFGLGGFLVVDTISPWAYFDLTFGVACGTKGIEYYEQQAAQLAIDGVRKMKEEGALPTDTHVTIYNDNPNFFAYLKETDEFSFKWKYGEGVLLDDIVKLKFAHNRAKEAWYKALECTEMNRYPPSKTPV